MITILMEETKRELSAKQSIEFFKYVDESFYKGHNGWLPKGYSPIIEGFTIEKLYEMFIKNEQC